MADSEVESCENCGTPIGRLETPHVFKSHIVCAACIPRLRELPPKAPPPAPPPYDPPQYDPQPAYPPQPAYQSPPAYQPIYRLPSQRKWQPGVAAVLSFFVPGAGQIYRGQIAFGLLWFAGVFVGYFMLVIPCIVLHLVCVFAAAAGDPYK